MTVSGAYLARLRCLRCGAEYPESAALDICPACRDHGQHVNALPMYDLDQLGGRWQADPAQPGLFGYRRLLPVAAATQVVSLGEGATPLLPVRRTADELGLHEVYLKDETRNPTWSYKDRLAAIAVTKARETGAGGVMVASSGNHGAAVAAYAAAAGLTCVVLTLESTPAAMKVLIQSYGARVVALRHGPDRWDLMRQAVREHGWMPASGFADPPAGSNPFGVDGYKTISYELVESLGRAPDVVVAPVAYGDGLVGMVRGFADLLALGVIGKLPRFVAAEVFGPYGRALETGAESASVGPARRSVAFSIATPVTTYQGTSALRASGGLAVAVPDDATTIAAQLHLARSEGIFLEASSAITLAALARLAKDGQVSPHESVVCIGTSTGLKDVGATAAALPPVPVIEPDLRALDAAIAP